MLFALQLAIQRFLQAVLRRGGREGFQVFAALFLLGLQGLQLLRSGGYGALQLGLAGLQAAPGKGGFLHLALQRTLLFAVCMEFALGFQHGFVMAGMLLLRLGQAQIQFFEA
jgi:hypothetical protein